MFFTFQFRPAESSFTRFETYEAETEQEAREQFQAQFPGATERRCTRAEFRSAPCTFER